MFQPYELKKNGQFLQAALHTPKVQDGEKYPLVLFLHGGGERGEDLQQVTSFSPGADVFAAPQWQQEHPCFVLAPQCPKAHLWEDYLDLLLYTVQQLPAEFPIDPMRVYVTGLSMGGAGTWSLLARDPYLFAAAMPICGFSDPKTLSKVKSTPIWAFHTEDDAVIPVTGAFRSAVGTPSVGTRQLVSYLRSIGNREVHYTEYPAGTLGAFGHAAWTLAYRCQEALEWMFTKTRYDRYQVELFCPGVYYIEDGVNASMYLVEGREKALLIDTGFGGGDFMAVVRSLTTLPVELAVTHAHLDHMRYSYLFPQFYMSPLDIPLLPRVQDAFPENTSKAEDVIPIAEGDVIDLGGVQIEVAAVGGHTPGTVVFIDRFHGCVFTGDALGLWMQVPKALPIRVYRENLLRLQKKLQQPGYTELAFLGGHKRQEGLCWPLTDTYVPNSYEKIQDMLELCDRILEHRAEETPFPRDFGEPAFEAVYKTANMVFTESVRK